MDAKKDRHQTMPQMQISLLGQAEEVFMRHPEARQTLQQIAHLALFPERRTEPMSSRLYELEYKPVETPPLTDQMQLLLENWQTDSGCYTIALRDLDRQTIEDTFPSGVEPETDTFIMALKAHMTEDREYDFVIEI